MLRLLTGKPCSICGKKHLIFHISQAPKDKKLEKISCALPFLGYEGSIVGKDTVKDYYRYPIDLKTFEIYLLTEEGYYCLSCGKSVSEEEYQLYDGYCEDCYYLECADLDDL
jgi:hypothetical protein